MTMPRFSFATLVSLAVACSGAEPPADDVAVDAAAVDSAAVDAATDSLPVLDGLATLAPRDDGPLDASFVRFRAQLLDAIARRDTAALLATVSPDIKLSFGGDYGAAAFREIWSPGAPDSELWPTLAKVLRHGGELSRSDADTVFMAPYVFTDWPADVDPFEHVATLSETAVVRVAPDSAATGIGALPYGIVRYRWDASAPAGWTAVTLPDGRDGWIASRDVHSPIDYRAFFEKSGGRWRMTILIAGD